ncbi:YacL family protein [Shewanella sp. FJAT-52076]|uniref:YacL family protein n=1 Tax=Shewanella sp. FJAT-52076 TaxID=2864202 RepID=UPI001C661CD4|nr:YacL family protein [Shewanella sp. FJAT-52076]QYJ76019.1 YacL family protein [Shewanella sp. FJAT-52076]
MEYEFRRNGLDGSVMARFSMEHEVMGRWFGEELGDKPTATATVLAAISAIQAGELREWRLTGREFSLELDEEQARVYANVLGYDNQDELDDGMSLYDAELEASCGLEDLEAALKSWQAFIVETR